MLYFPLKKPRKAFSHTSRIHISYTFRVLVWCYISRLRAFFGGDMRIRANVLCVLYVCLCAFVYCVEKGKTIRGQFTHSALHITSSPPTQWHVVILSCDVSLSRPSAIDDARPNFIKTDPSRFSFLIKQCTRRANPRKNFPKINSNQNVIPFFSTSELLVH